MQELQAQAVENAKSLEKLRKEKIWELEGEVGEGTAARTVPVKILRNHPILRRRRRRRAEEAADLDAFMGRHPLFSRYGTEGDTKSWLSVLSCQFCTSQCILAAILYMYKHPSNVLLQSAEMKYWTIFMLCRGILFQWMMFQYLSLITLLLIVISRGEPMTGVVLV